jgi:hypothetical protein
MSSEGASFWLCTVKAGSKTLTAERSRPDRHERLVAVGYSDELLRVGGEPREHV